MADGSPKLQPLDLATLIYAGIATIALAWTVSIGPVAGAGWLVAAHALLVAVVFLAPRARQAGPVGRFVGDWYPLLLLGGLYSELGLLTLAQAVSHDPAIQRLETLVFGSQPSVDWIRATPSPGLSWLLHLSYLSYYPVLYASPLGLWLRGQREAARETILALMLTFYICYAISLFLPVAGPRYAFALADNAATVVWPARAAQWLLNRADSWGVAFPSSHVAASVVATGMAIRYWPRLGFVLLPFTVGLALAVVYGQFHYAVDALAGLVLAAVMLLVMGAARAHRGRGFSAARLSDVRGDGWRRQR